MKPPKILPFMNITLFVFLTAFVTSLFAADTQGSGEVFILQNGKPMEMDYVIGTAYNLGIKAGTGLALGSALGSGGVAGGLRQFAIMAQGEHAQMKIADKTPVFYVRRHPSEFILAKFENDTFNKKPVRYITKNGFLKLGMEDGTQGVPEKNKIAFDYKKEENGQYKIILKNPLENGDYAVIIETIQPGGAYYEYKIFDFGIVG